MKTTVEALKSKQAELTAKLAAARLKSPEVVIQEELNRVASEMAAAQAEEERRWLEAKQAEYDQLTERAAAEVVRCLKELEVIQERIRPILEEFRATYPVTRKYDALTVHKARPYTAILSQIFDYADASRKGAPIIAPELKHR